jgi:hypothetical protein
MARADLSAMLGKLGDDDPKPPAEPAAAPQPTVRPSVAAKPAKRAVPARSDAVAPTSGNDPLYLRLERKETRLREDQYAALTEHARRLNRAKGTGGERITENTLIRVAIDLLLSRIDQVTGTDESELRNSVSL